jgi:hypothetical protein
VRQLAQIAPFGTAPRSPLAEPAPRQNGGDARASQEQD